MAKKTLKERVKLVWRWTIILSITYFLIGIYLKSDGFNINPSITYELIKDTLTLTAAFLAPVAAFVLFSDWREEHQTKSLHALIDEIKVITQDIENTLKQYMHNIFHSDRLITDEFKTSKEGLKLLGQLTVLSRLYLDVNEIDENTKMLKEHIDVFGEQSRKATEALGMMDWSRFRKKQIEGNSKNLDTNDGECKFLQNYFKENHSIFELSFQVIRKLNDQIIVIGNVIKQDI